MSDRRFPASVYRVGEEPDPRFSLANERTFLAWVRTALALLAVGVAIEALQLPIPAALRFASAMIFIALGVIAVVHSWLTWARTERSLRLNQALPGLSTGAIVAVGVVIAAVVLVVGFAV